MTYDKEGWWAVCKRACPDLTRESFERRWRAIWFMAHGLGVAEDMRCASQN